MDKLDPEATPQQVFGLNVWIRERQQRDSWRNIAISLIDPGQEANRRRKLVLTPVSVEKLWFAKLFPA